MLQLKGNECECNFLDWLMKVLHGIIIAGVGSDSDSEIVV